MGLIKKLLIGGALLTAVALGGCATNEKVTEKPKTYESRDPRAILYDHEAGMSYLKKRREKDSEENKAEFQEAVNRYHQETLDLATKKEQELEELKRRVREYLEKHSGQ